MMQCRLPLSDLTAALNLVPSGFWFLTSHTSLFLVYCEELWE